MMSIYFNRFATCGQYCQTIVSINRFVKGEPTYFLFVYNV